MVACLFLGHWALDVGCWAFSLEVLYVLLAGDHQTGRRQHLNVINQLLQLMF